MLESAQYDKETRTARGKRKMEGKNIYLSVFPEFLELLQSQIFRRSQINLAVMFVILKLATTIDLQAVRMTIMFRITS